MKRKDLKTGMVVETREGVLSLIMEDKLVGINAWASLDEYYNDLKHFNYKDCDIVKVYKKDCDFTINDLINKTCLSLIWQRKEPPQLTDRERAYLKAYSYDFEWVARDKNKTVYVFVTRPNKHQNCWSNEAGCDCMIDDNMFDFIKWEDEEPYKISDLLGE